MDLLRNLGSAAVSSLVQKSGLNLPFALGDKVSFFEGKSIWTLYDGTKRDDGSQVSIFFFDANQPPRRNLLPLAKNALKKLRTVRHPDVLKFLDAVETDYSIYIMTERVRPLGKALQDPSFKNQKDKEEWLIWGLQRLSTALAFVNDSCVSTHGNLRVDSIFLSPSGEWKLGGFEVLSSAKDDAAVLYYNGHLLPDANMYASPEVKKEGWSVLKEHHPSVADAYALGLFMHSIFNPSQPLPATAQPPHPPPQPSSRGAIPQSLFSSFKRLLNPNAKSRLSPAAFLETGMSSNSGDGRGFFVNNRFVTICSGLDQFGLSSEADKASLLRSLKEAAPALPPEFASHRVLPSLVSALEYGGANASTILPLMLQMGAHVSPADYMTVVLPPIAKLYASPDRGTRMALLDHLGDYVEKLDQKFVTDKVWPHLQTGFTDIVPVIREATVKAIGSLYPKFNDRIMNNDLLRHLAKMQMDQEASIRTNTCILIGRLGPSLGYNTKRKVLVPAFHRALKDTFVHARVAGLMAFMATMECFDVEDVATKIVPCISFTLVDKEKLVRDQAFKALELFVKRLEAHASTMPDTVLHENGQPAPPASSLAGSQSALVNSATGAAGVLAGWAMSSLSKKLVPGDLQSTMSSLTAMDRPTSAPPSTLSPTGMTGSASESRSPSLVTSPLASTLSSPGTPSRSLGNQNRGLQLGANKQKKVVPASLAAELTSEAESEAANAWGSEDLMDVNADEGDWSAFESALDADDSKTGSMATRSKSAVSIGLGFGDVPIPMANTPTIAVDDLEWGDMDPEASQNASVAVSTWDSNYDRPPSPLIQDRTLSVSSPRVGSSPKHNGLVQQKAASLPVARTPSPANALTKEEKAAEMARRKEERKQRIAQLKEQKKQPTAKSS